MDNLEALLTPEYNEGQVDDETLTESPEPEGEALETTQEDGDEEYDEDETSDVDDDGEGQDDTSEENQSVVPKTQYDNLRVDYTKKAMELADLKRALAKQQAEQPQQQSGNPNVSKSAPMAGGIRNFIQEQINAELGKAMAPLEEERKSLEIRETVVGLADRYPDDFDEVAPLFIEMLEEDPSVLESFDMSKGVELVFKAARSDYLERTAEARAKAQQKSKEDSRRQKRIVNESTPAAASRDGEKSEEELIRESIMAGTNRGSIFNF